MGVSSIKHRIWPDDAQIVTLWWLNHKMKTQNKQNHPNRPFLPQDGSIRWGCRSCQTTASYIRFFVYVSCHNKNENSEFGMTIHISLNYTVGIQLVIFYFFLKRALCVSSPQDYNLAGHIEELPNLLDLTTVQDWILNIPAIILQCC